MNITEKAKNIIDNCRFCWMCRHVCPIGNATGQERNTARARALGASLVVRGAAALKEIADNVYECMLCGACTNNCVTGWDPKVFIQELKTEIVLNGETPAYIAALLDKYQKTGSVYGQEVCKCLDELYNTYSETLLFVGDNALYNSPESIKNAVALLKKAGVKVSLTKEQDSGAALWFLTGKTQETQNAAKKCAEDLNKYKTVIVYDPADLSLIHYAYARELDDCETGRKLIDKVGVNKEMLLIGKEANAAAQPIMAQYMPDVMTQVAKDRWKNAENMGCKTLVTESPAEYVALKATAPQGYRVISVEEMLMENL